MIADSLFHFTGFSSHRFDYLKSIIGEQSFLASYNIEHTSDIHDSPTLAIPMVCFCDIPLEIYFNEDLDKPKVGRYGTYGIGIEKGSWDEENRINPIFYRKANSIYSEKVREINRSVKNLKDVASILKEVIDERLYETVIAELQQIDESMLTQSHFSKPYEKDDKLYYKAREWRYLPERDSPILEMSDEKSIRRLNESYRKLEAASLKFRIDEVTHVIVERPEVVEDMKKFISTTLEIEDSQKSLLIEKVIDVQTIKQDM